MNSEEIQATALRIAKGMRTTLLDFSKLMADIEADDTKELPQTLLCSLAFGFYTQLGAVEHIVEKLVHDHADMAEKLRNAIEECDTAYKTELEHIALLQAIEKEQRRPRAKRRTVAQLRATLEDD